MLWLVPRLFFRNVFIPADDPKIRAGTFAWAQDIRHNTIAPPTFGETARTNGQSVGVRFSPWSEEQEKSYEKSHKYSLTSRGKFDIIRTNVMQLD